MGRLTDELVSLIERQVRDAGIVVWYDPEEVYSTVSESLAIPGATVLHLSDSFFELRERIEPFLEFVGDHGRVNDDVATSPKLVIYVPREQRETRHALIEAESAGAVIRPAAEHPERNTSLKVIAERVFRSIAPDQAAKIADDVEQKRHSLEELDRLAEMFGEISSGAVKLIFETASATDVALAFAATDACDGLIQSKQALPEIANIFKMDLGIEIDQSEPLSAIRNSLRRTMLLSEFISCLPRGAAPKQLSSLSFPNGERQLEMIRQICKQWRNRADYRESYVEAARTVERDASVEHFDLDPSLLVEVETFSSVETRLLLHGEQCILSSDPALALDVARKRKDSFWCMQEPTSQLRWSLIETAARLMIAASSIKKELKAIKRDPVAMVAAYVDGLKGESSADPMAWSMMDTYHRHLERQYTTFDLEIGGEHDLLEQVINRARQTYMDIVSVCVEAFTAALEATDFAIKGSLIQREIFSTVVAPLMKQTKSAEAKVAYVLVDAMRFEMGRELVDGLGDEFDINLQPAIAQLPSITEVGMSALLPGAETGLELVAAGVSKVAIKIGSNIFKDRASRVKHFQQTVEGALVHLKLNDLMKPSKKLRDEIMKSDFVLVTSQEIDRRGEEADDEDEARRYMDEVLDKLRRGIRRLASMGVTDFVITADHGHLFGESIESGMKIDAPGGNTVDLHRRVWIGRGGSSGATSVRIPVSRVGLGGDLELVFPRSLACFTAKGGSTSFFHGSASFQELVIPVAVLKAKRVQPTTANAVVTLSIERPRITTRFFSVAAQYSVTDLFGPNERRVKIIAKSGKKEVGGAVMAAYGFEEGAQEIILHKDKPNAITVMLTDDSDLKTLSIHIIDAVTQVELNRLADISVDLAM